MENCILIKLGGSTITNLHTNFFKSLIDIYESGKKVIIVHGGGPFISHYLTELEVPFKTVNGLRSTSKEAMTLVQMVLSGKVNKELVLKISEQQLKVIGISGCDGGLLQVSPHTNRDLEYVGEVQQVNHEYIKQLLHYHDVVVISPVGYGTDYEPYNINADDAAGAVADALGLESCVYVTDVDGVLVQNEIAKILTPSKISQLISEKEITGGMIPKMQSAVKALQGSVREVYVVNGAKQFTVNSLNWSGTKVVL